MSGKMENTLITLGIVGAVAYFLWKKFGGLETQAVGAVADWWVNLTSGGPITVPGNALLPDGSKVPIASLQIKSDTQGNVFTLIQGIGYQLQPSNADGDWPAVRVG